MKTTLLLTMSLLLSLAGFSQEIPASQVPVSVLKTFKNYFPTASKVEWEKKLQQFEAEFEIKRVDHKALFDEKGKLIVYKKDIPFSQLPAPVKQAIRKQYKGFKVDDVQRIARSGNLYYQVELDGHSQPDQKVVFTRDGKIENAHAY